MPERLSYLIIGSGIAGATAAEIMRNEDAAAEITIVADDPFPVYYRPALKDYLAGKVREDKLWARPVACSMSGSRAWSLRMSA
jgi:NADPH-dependent 2,4-dienoyl-CoA reductase/sulfur reductase-like enzyme